MTNIRRLKSSPDKWVVYAIWLFMLGWVTVGFTVYDVGKYSILLLYVAAVPFFKWISPRSFSFVILPSVSTFFSIFVGLLKHVPAMSIVSQAALQLLAILFATGVAALDWRKYLFTLTKIMVVISGPIVLYGCYQVISRPIHGPYSFLPVTNQQAYAIGGLQRGWGAVPFSRASSVFVEPSDYGYFCLWLLVLGLSASKGAWRYCAIGLSFVGILASQSLTGGLGVVVLILIYLAINPISIQTIRQIAIVVVFCTMSVFAIQPLMPQAFAKFTDRIEQALTLDERADSGRIDHIPACWEIFKDAPIWGHGLASFNSADANGIDVTTMTYALLLMERGSVGTFLFLAPWVMLGAKSYMMAATDSFRTPALLFTALNLYTFATSSIVYFLPFWLSLAISASLAIKTYAPATELAFKWNGVNSLGEPAEA
jgi:hypothetical protein